jgi:sulfate transport system substrate-binding protein
MERLDKAGLTRREGNEKPYRHVTKSVVVLGFREGNPKKIKGWEDLTRDDVDVICPSPLTSGGAKWFITALYGYAMNAYSQDETKTQQFIQAVVSRIKVMDKGARGSMTTFEQGMGDVIITYENEAILRQKKGQSLEYSIPEPTILIENPIAVLQQYSQINGSEEVAKEFVEYVCSETVQKMFVEYGFRPAISGLSKEEMEMFSTPENLLTIQELGGWDIIDRKLFSEEGIWSQVMRMNTH